MIRTSLRVFENSQQLSSCNSDLLRLLPPWFYQQLLKVTFLTSTALLQLLAYLLTRYVSSLFEGLATFECLLMMY